MWTREEVKEEVKRHLNLNNSKIGNREAESHAEYVEYLAEKNGTSILNEINKLEQLQLEDYM